MKKIDVITSFYNDIHKLTWKSYVENCNLIIYRKNDDLNIGESFVKDGYINIPNIGRCDYSFLLHIINNYYTLNDVTVFTTIHWYNPPPTFNFSYIIKNCVEYDYMEIGRDSKCYNWHDGTVPEKLCIDVNINNVKGVRKGWYKSNSDSNIDWYNHIFGKGSFPGKIYTNDHGPIFSVSKKLIYQRPISVYQYLLERFHPKSMSWDHELAKSQWPEKYGNCATEKQIMDEMGRHYHDELLRFWKLLFTHRIDKNQFKIH